MRCGDRTTDSRRSLSAQTSASSGKPSPNTVRTKSRTPVDASLVVRRVAEVGHGLYAAKSYLARYPVRSAADLKGRPLLTGPAADVETKWFAKLAKDTPPTFTSVLAVALAEAARTGAGIAVLPRFLGDAIAELEHLPMPDEPHETLWLTVHRDLRSTPRVRAVLDFLIGEFKRERLTLRGR